MAKMRYSSSCVTAVAAVMRKNSLLLFSPLFWHVVTHFGEAQNV